MKQNFDRSEHLVSQRFIDQALKNSFYVIDSSVVPKPTDDPQLAYVDEDGYYNAKYMSEPNDVKKHDDPFMYKMNSHGFRTKHFKPLNKNKTTIVFGGCSITSGAAMSPGTYWPDIFMSKLNPDKYDSYNIALNGGSVVTTLHNFRVFADLYGAPEYYLALVPDFERNMVYDADQDFITKITRVMPDHPLFSKPYVKKFMTAFDTEDLVFDSVSNLYMLESLCKAHGTKLIWTTWDTPSLNLAKLLDFKSLINLPSRSEIQHMPLVNKDNLDWWDVAKDKGHPGSKYHTFVADVFYKEVFDGV